MTQPDVIVYANVLIRLAHSKRDSSGAPAATLGDLRDFIERARWEGGSWDDIVKNAKNLHVRVERELAPPHADEEMLAEEERET